MHKYINSDEPGVAILVVEAKKIYHQKGYGLADLTTKTKIDGLTQFRLASVSKPLTALAILQLVEKRHLELKSKVSKYFKGKLFKKIRVKHLLNHTSGLPHYEDIFDDHWPEKAGLANLKDFLPMLKKYGKPQFRAGRKFEYCNSNYVLLALLIAKVTKISFATYMKKYIFDPVGMKHTLVYVPKQKFNQRAFGYDKHKKTQKYVLNDYHYLNGMAGDGGIYSTLVDLYKLDLALRNEPDRFTENVTPGL